MSSGAQCSAGNEAAAAAAAESVRSSGLVKTGGLTKLVCRDERWRRAEPGGVREQ